MPWWLLLASIFFVWCLWAIATTLENVPLINGELVDEQRGTSVAPIIPVFPLLLWGIAKLIDLFAEPWGTWTIGSLHAVYAVFLVGSIMSDLWRLRAAEEFGKQFHRDERRPEV